MFQPTASSYLGFCKDGAPALSHEALPGDVNAEHVERVEYRLLAPDESGPRLDLIRGAGKDVVAVAVSSLNGGLQLREAGGHLRRGYVISQRKQKMIVLYSLNSDGIAARHVHTQLKSGNLISAAPAQGFKRSYTSGT